MIIVQGQDNFVIIKTCLKPGMSEAWCPNSSSKQQHGSEAVGHLVSCGISRHFSGGCVGFEVFGFAAFNVSKEAEGAAMSKSK